MEREKSILETALHYLSKSYSVIPIKGDKKPFIPWSEYQQKKPTEDEIREWWDKWPSANVAIVTGKVSNICAVDIDEPQGLEAIQNYIPDSLVIPTCKTPGGGQHLYFQFPDKPLRNNARVIPGCDFRGKGGYIIAPPSTNDKGKMYSWLDNLSLDDTPPPAMPSELLNFRKVREMKICFMWQIVYSRGVCVYQCLLRFSKFWLLIANLRLTLKKQILRFNQR